MLSARVLGTVLLAVGLGGCSSSNRTASDAGVTTATFVGRACTTDLECGSLRCDDIRRQCICLSDESCRPADSSAAPRYCNNYTGLCVDEVAGCKADSECQTGEFCDPSIRSCRSLKSFCEECTGDLECGGVGDDCVLDGGSGRAYCAKACAVPADCPRGSDCVTLEGKLQCVPNASAGASGEGAACRSFRGCTPDSLRSCNDNTECAELGDQRCDPASGKCVAIEQVCPFGTVCDPRNRICVAECTQDVDCGDPALRCSDRVCEPVGECQVDTECPSNKVCGIAPGQTAGQCVAFCQGDKDCALGRQCQKGSDNRYRCVEGCATNKDCAIDQRCNASSKKCEGPAVGAVRVCQASAACNTCELCDGTVSECVSATATASPGSFPYCKSCSSPTECPGGACVSMEGGNFCAKSCGPGTECPQGFVCLSTSAGTSACVPADKQCAGKCP